MDKFFVLLILLMTNISMYSQNGIKKDSLLIQTEIRKDSLSIRLESQKDIFREPIEFQELRTTATEVELNHSEIDNNSVVESSNDLSYRLKIISDLKPKRLFHKWSYSLNEYNFNYGIGNFRQGGITLLYKPLDKLTISLGGSTVNYNIFHSRYNDVVFNINATYEFTDWMSLNLFGQYSVNSMHNAHYGGYMFSPQTSYGATLKFKTSEKVDINIGVERSLNSMTKQWETSGILGPIIRLK